MDIPIHADVFCDSQLCGRSTFVIINPVNEQITHVVVEEKDFPNIEHLVPVDQIIETSPSTIKLSCNPTGLAGLESFRETDFIDGGQLETAIPYQAPYLVWPYSMYDAMPMPLEHKNIPAGEVAIHRNTPVKAVDGQVGKVDEFLVNAKTDSITHLVLREGHLWGQKDVTIPVSEIERIADGAVLLKLDKKAIASLPAIPLHRKWK
jgi:sporulation protein YlmC with PRC-barrel domain